MEGRRKRHRQQLERSDAPPWWRCYVQCTYRLCPEWASPQKYTFLGQSSSVFSLFLLNINPFTCCFVWVVPSILVVCNICDIWYICDIWGPPESHSLELWSSIKWPSISIPWVVDAFVLFVSCLCDLSFDQQWKRWAPLCIPPSQKSRGLPEKTVIVRGI